MTGLPFVYAFWAGAPGAVTPADVRALQAARDDGRRESDDVAAEYFAREPERTALGAAYLRAYIRYEIGDRERAALERFFALAAEIGAAPPARALRFYEGPASDGTEVRPEPAGARALE
jgi:predicted solute-binding protein